MVVDEHDADFVVSSALVRSGSLARGTGDVAACRAATVARTRRRSPPSARARSRMPRTPKCPGRCQSCGRPRPSSTTSIASACRRCRCGSRCGARLAWRSALVTRLLQDTVRGQRVAFAEISRQRAEHRARTRSPDAGAAIRRRARSPRRRARTCRASADAGAESARASPRRASRPCRRSAARSRRRRVVVLRGARATARGCGSRSGSARFRRAARARCARARPRCAPARLRRARGSARAAGAHPPLRRAR